ncbi:MAG: HIT family protein [Candidatus Cloacimonetes bacterium]|nr:HIT family protein [Candidatus Cloacimonadota bacterium]
MSQCAICDRLELLAHYADSSMVYEFPNSYLVLGSHQYFPGYCVLLYKQHVRELHELTPELQAALNEELMMATTAIVKAFNPWKVNHACLGNQDQHIHWHIIPRYETEADHQKHPWLHADEFPNWLIPPQKQQEVIALLRIQLQAITTR